MRKLLANPGEKRWQLGPGVGGHRAGGGMVQFGRVWKFEPTRFPDGLDVGCESRGGVQVDSQARGLSAQVWICPH